MSLSYGDLSAADVAAVVGNNRDGGFGNWGDGSFWIIILFLFAFMNNGNWGNGGGNNGSGYGMNVYPPVQQGFDQAAVMNGINQINSSICSGFSAAEASANARQIADMQAGFANQTAMMQGFNGTQTAMNQGFNSVTSQLSQCCCDNRLATVQTQGIVQNEANATRFADANNTRDIIESNNKNTQAVLDKLCALELDNYKGQLAQAQRDNVALQNQLNMAALRESQTAQNAFISQGFANEVDQLYNRLSNCPVPTTPVYGRTPIFTCNQNQGCGCGCNM